MLRAIPFLINKLMPFTFSHPAIVLPLVKVKEKWFSLTGLVIGSVVPDFEYFLRMDAKKVYMHTWEALFSIDLFIALLLAFAFHNVVRNPLLYNVSRPLQKRLLPFTLFNWNQYFKKNWYIVLLSLLIGEVSHFGWDSFTHANYFTQYTPSRTEKIYRVENHFHLFEFMQVASSVVGALLVLYAIWQLPKHKSLKTNPHIATYWIILTLIACGAYFIRSLFETSVEFHEALIFGVTAVLIGLIFTPVVLRIIRIIKTPSA